MLFLRILRIYLKSKYESVSLLVTHDHVVRGVDETVTSQPEVMDFVRPLITTSVFPLWYQSPSQLEGREQRPTGKRYTFLS